MSIVIVNPSILIVILLLGIFCHFNKVDEIDVGLPICLLPPMDGDGEKICLAAFYRYFFNKDTGTCEEFFYGGCGGNENNFLTREDCEQTCLTI